MRTEHARQRHQEGFSSVDLPARRACSGTPVGVYSKWQAKPKRQPAEARRFWSLCFRFATNMNQVAALTWHTTCGWSPECVFKFFQGLTVVVAGLCKPCQLTRECHSWLACADHRISCWRSKYSVHYDDSAFAARLTLLSADQRRNLAR